MPARFADNECAEFSAAVRTSVPYIRYAPVSNRELRPVTIELRYTFSLGR